MHFEETQFAGLCQERCGIAPGWAMGHKVEVLPTRNVGSGEAWGGGMTKNNWLQIHTGQKGNNSFSQWASVHCLPINSDTLKALHGDFSICTYRCMITIENAQNPTIMIRDIFSTSLAGTVSFQNQFAICNCSIQLKDHSLKIFLTLLF